MKCDNFISACRFLQLSAKRIQSAITRIILFQLLNLVTSTMIDTVKFNEENEVIYLLGMQIFLFRPLRSPLTQEWRSWNPSRLWCHLLNAISSSSVICRVSCGWNVLPIESGGDIRNFGYSICNNYSMAHFRCSQPVQDCSAVRPQNTILILYILFFCYKLG